MAPENKVTGPKVLLIHDNPVILHDLSDGMPINAAIETKDFIISLLILNNALIVDQMGIMVMKIAYASSVTGGERHAVDPRRTNEIRDMKVMTI